jgi:hypothetical protein
MAQRRRTSSNATDETQSNVVTEYSRHIKPASPASSGEKIDVCFIERQANSYCAGSCGFPLRTITLLATIAAIRG